MLQRGRYTFFNLLVLCFLPKLAVLSAVTIVSTQTDRQTEKQRKKGQWSETSFTNNGGFVLPRWGGVKYLNCFLLLSPQTNSAVSGY